MDSNPQALPEQPKKFKDRLYTVRYNKDGTPIVHKDKDGKSDNQRKREWKEISKTLSPQQRQDIKNSTRREMEKKQNAVKVLAMRIAKTTQNET